MTTNLDEIIAKERHRRLRLKAQRRPMYHWMERGDLEPPPKDIWCDYCACFYGVPHDTLHVDPITKQERMCPSLSRAIAGDRQCACIDCVSAEKIYGEGSLQSRITQA